MNPRRLRPVAAGMLGLLVLTACGSRANDALLSQARQAQLTQGGGGSGGGAAGDLGTGSGTAGSGTTGTGGTGGAGTTGTGTAGTGTGGAGTVGGTTGVPAPPGGNGGATDVGITATTINLGIIADQSGPVPGLFAGAVAGTQAYVAKVNSEGGLFGRKIKLDVRDSQMDCGQYQANTASIVAKDFAMVGSFSLYDGCGVSVLKTKPTFADIHSALQNTAQAYANNFSVAPLERGWRTGPLEYFKKRFGAAFQHIGTIYASVGGGAESWANCEAAINHEGGAVLYKRAFGATDTNFTADIVQMRQKGVQMIYMPATNAATAANVVNAARSQNVDWPIVFGGPAYDKVFLDQAGANAEGVFEDQQYALFFNPSDAANIPAVAEYQKWMKQSGHSSDMDLFSAYGWSSVELFVQALKAAGAKATRADLLAQLKKVHSFDAGGLLAAGDPAGKHAPRQWLFSQVKNGQWVRVETPAKAFRADGGYFLA